MKVAFGPGEGSLPYDTVVLFKDYVEEHSDGEIEVELFPDSQLGSDTSVLNALRQGNIESTLLSTALTSLVPEFGVFDIPFLFANREKVEQIAHGEIWEEDLRGMLPQKDLVGIGFWEAGFRQVTNNEKPITEPEDLEGLSIRVPESEIRMALFSHFGANPIAMDFGEVFTGLQQGVIDGQEGPLSNTKGARMEEVQKYLSVTNHVYSPAYMIASKKWFDSLSGEHQKIILEAGRYAGDEIRKQAEELDGELLDYFEQEGMEVNQANVEAFQSEMDPVIDIIKNKIDPEFVDKVVEAAK
nr:TRAP transporter substrate-binding protein [Bacillus piscicola]